MPTITKLNEYSLGIALPKKQMRRLGWKKGDELFTRVVENKMILFRIEMED